jgi:hypothetical protein
MNADRSGIFEEAHSVINEKVRDHSIDFTRLLYMLSQDMDNLIRQTDTKAQIILGVNAILAAMGAASISCFWRLCCGRSHACSSR